jgi:hypothetical protein
VSEQEKHALVPQQLSLWFKYLHGTLARVWCALAVFKDGPAQYVHVKQVQYVEAQENNYSLIIIPVTFKLYL